VRRLSIASTTQDRAYVRTAKRYSYGCSFVVVSLLPGRAPVRAVAIPLQCSSADHSGYTFRLRLFTQRAHGSEQTVIFRCHILMLRIVAALSCTCPSRGALCSECILLAWEHPTHQQRQRQDSTATARTAQRQRKMASTSQPNQLVSTRREVSASPVSASMASTIAT
jgi:hypothetical protein